MIIDHPSIKTYQHNLQKIISRSLAMGSMDNAVIYGFVCRLCSEAQRNVIHLYGEKGRKMKLLPIIKSYLSIDIHASDMLPKTVCQSCADNVIDQYNFIQNVRRNRKFIMNYQKKKIPINDLLINRQALSRSLQ